MSIIYDNKTKITGALLATIAVIQANSAAIQALISPKAFAWFAVVVGAFVTFLGFLNSSSAIPDSKAPAVVIPPTVPPTSTPSK